MKEKYFVHKRWGETPLEALERLRAEEGIAADVPMTYAGRLDPAAEGLLIILTGEECKNKDAYSKLDKTYVAGFLFGVQTDTFDLLGIPVLREGAEISLPAELPSEYASVKQSSSAEISAPSLRTVEVFLNALIGTQSQKYPPYSSKTVDGKQLHQHAKEGSEVELPVHDVTLYGYKDISTRAVPRAELIERVEVLSSKVKGDFRQAEILAAWHALALSLPETLQVVTVELSVGSGFYIRQLAEDMGASLYSLDRIKIGEYM